MTIVLKKAPKKPKPYLYCEKVLTGFKNIEEKIDGFLSKIYVGKRPTCIGTRGS
ncbi:hypothetical protein SPHINGO8BC_60366 [Sphingobacterium multivorum]|uniref:Uncharacterized protein n=1 Tax=Sphingobacterium multivorum TaxID=28454 RepID=A0A654DH73_SPHMU|nr:hypothetical protein SPHINGO8BC_60366 [Sphingobacterium multivorum]